jgi:hypothetical protein
MTRDDDTTTTTPLPRLPASVFRLTGERRAVCALEGGGVVEVVLAPTSTRTFMAPGAGGALGAHVWAPRTVCLQGPIVWNGARGVLEAADVC